MASRTTLCLLYVLWVVAVAAPQRARAAEPPNIADLERALVDEVLPLYRAKAYDASIAAAQRVLDALAASAYSGADVMLLRARLLLIVAGSHDFMRRPERALDGYIAYLTALDGVPGEDENRARALSRKQALSAAFALTVSPSDAAITIDGQAPRRDHNGVMLLLPGVHVLRVEAPGFTAHEASVTAEGGQTLAYNVALLRLAVAQPAPRDTGRAIALWTGVGIGVAGAATGIVGAVMAHDRRGTIEDAADPEGVVSPDAMSHRQAVALADEAERFDIVAIVGFVVAGVGAVAATAAVLWPEPETRATTGTAPDWARLQITPRAGGGTIAWSTRF